MYQRYRLNVRFHKSYSGADFFVSGLFGLETTDLSEFRKELRSGFGKDHDEGDMKADNAAGTEGTNSGNVLAEAVLDEELDDEVSADETSGDEDSSSAKGMSNCEKMFSLDGFTLGVEAGLGVVIARYIGLTGSASYEFNFSWAQQVSFSSGIAFNLREVWPWAKKSLRSTWVSFEMVFQRYFNRGVREWAVAGFLGVQFGI